MANPGPAHKIPDTPFFKDLKGSKTGLPDSDLPERERELINVIGFPPPDNEGDVVSPVGAAAARLSAIPISEGFNLGFARCKPGRVHRLGLA
jgi:hypothetical protein